MEHFTQQVFKIKARAYFIHGINIFFCYRNNAVRAKRDFATTKKSLNIFSDLSAAVYQLIFM